MALHQAGYAGLMNTSFQTDTYDRRSIVLHWASAALVLGLWCVGQTIDWFPRGTPRITMRSLHISFGVLLAFLVLARLLWWAKGGTRPAAEPGLVGKLASSAHGLLYLLLIAALGAGIALTLVRGDNLFGLYKLSSIAPDNKPLRHDIGELHEWAANILLSLAFLHAAAAVWHHRVLKDGVLRRMWPSLK